MNLLIDYLPSSVTIGGADFKIRSDFRTSILFEQLMFDSTIEDKEKIALALELYYPDELERINNANMDEAAKNHNIFSTASSMLALLIRSSSSG